MTSEEFRVVEALITEKSREIARTEISRALRKISEDFQNAYLGGRFDNDETGVGNAMISYLEDTMTSAANQI